MEKSTFKDLFSDDRCNIWEKDGLRELILKQSPWDSKITKLARRFKANSFDFFVTRDWQDQSLAFLAEFPGLKSLNINLPADWKDLTFLDHVPGLISLNLNAGSVMINLKGHPILPGLQWNR